MFETNNNTFPGSTQYIFYVEKVREKHPMAFGCFMQCIMLYIQMTKSLVHKEILFAGISVIMYAQEDN